MQFDLGIFGKKNLDNASEFYQRFNIQLPTWQKPQNIALSFSKTLFNDDENDDFYGDDSFYADNINSDSLNQLQNLLLKNLQADYLADLDKTARQFFSNSALQNAQQKHLIQDFIDEHFENISDELWQYHQIHNNNGTDFLAKLSLSAIHFWRIEQQICTVLDYAIDGDLSDQLLVIYFDQDAQIINISHDSE
ncbi:hypothetical protein [Acinetobacter sp. c1-l78]|uniref:hypothetical protein n=1 Tax=Acinetobacter sp. c1-l78 TaxID=3342803 RepID=UPI0035B82F78